MKNSTQSKGSGTGLAGHVLAGPFFQEGSKIFLANHNPNAWLKTGLE